MGNDMDKKGILTVRMMGTISVEYEGEFFPIGTALTGKILQLFLILLYAGKKGVGILYFSSSFVISYFSGWSS